MYQMHGTSLLSTPLPLWTSIITLGKKIDDKKTLLLKKNWLYGPNYLFEIDCAFHRIRHCMKKIVGSKVGRSLILVVSICFKVRTF